jgi:hypothetical protein
LRFFRRFLIGTAGLLDTGARAFHAADELAWIDAKDQGQDNHDDEADPAAGAGATTREPAAEAAALPSAILDIFALSAAVGLHRGILSGEYFALFSANAGGGATVAQLRTCSKLNPLVCGTPIRRNWPLLRVALVLGENGCFCERCRSW